MRAALLACAVLLCGCPAPRINAATETAPAGWAFSTLRAEHRVTIEVALPGGKQERRTLLGAIAVARPDRFRLRALGPGGMTLFDLVSVRGQVRVVESIKNPNEGGLRALIEAMARDLSAAFQLEPAPPGRTTRVDGAALVVEEPERSVRLTGWRKLSGGVVATRIEIVNTGAKPYRVSVDARDNEVDPPLDPALFSSD